MLLFILNAPEIVVLQLLRTFIKIITNTGKSIANNAPVPLQTYSEGEFYVKDGLAIAIWRGPTSTLSYPVRSSKVIFAE